MLKIEHFAMKTIKYVKNSLQKQNGHINIITSLILCPSAKVGPVIALKS